LEFPDILKEEPFPSIEVFPGSFFGFQTYWGVELFSSQGYALEITEHAIHLYYEHRADTSMV
jgi:hypothetical protein